MYLYIILCKENLVKREYYTHTHELIHKPTTCIPSNNLNHLKDSHQKGGNCDFSSIPINVTKPVPFI